MAKSLRSKWKRKCRAVKRERYNKKEVELLKKTLSNDPCNKPSDVDMTDVNEIATIVDKKNIKGKRRKEKSASTANDDDDEMVMDTSTKQRIFNPRTMKDQHGTYPVWMHPRKIHKRKKAGKGNGKLKKKGKSK